MNGTIPVHSYYFDQAYLGNEAATPIWTAGIIEDLRRRVRARDAVFTYDNRPLYDFFETRKLIAGGRGLVIGSENPWLEAMLLEFGARHITTLEFGKINSSHPQVETRTPHEFTKEVLGGMFEPFDFAFTYSSLEHDGLGRYGDVLNPDGDLHTMARLTKIVKPGGFVFLGIPCCRDELFWNAHRVYGKIRLRAMFGGYNVIGVHPSDAISRITDATEFRSFQPVWVLQNAIGCSKQSQD